MKECKKCGNELTGKWQITFCSRSCATSFNNKGVRRHGQTGRYEVVVTCTLRTDVTAVRFRLSAPNINISKRGRVNNINIIDQMAYAPLAERHMLMA
jgi:hypothetical protein